MPSSLHKLLFSYGIISLQYQTLLPLWPAFTHSYSTALHFTIILLTYYYSVLEYCLPHLRLVCSSSYPFPSNHSFSSWKNVVNGFYGVKFLSKPASHLINNFLKVKSKMLNLWNYATIYCQWLYEYFRLKMQMWKNC